MVDNITTPVARKKVHVGAGMFKAKFRYESACETSIRLVQIRNDTTPSAKP